VATGCRHPSLRYWPPLEAKTTVTHSLPHLENDHYWSNNDFWSWNLGNLSKVWLQEFISEVLVAFSGNTVHDIFVTHYESNLQRSVKALCSC
jgi:hypothetical protein